MPHFHVLPLFMVFLALGGSLEAQQRARSRDRQRLFREGDVYVATAASCSGPGTVVRFDRETYTPQVFLQSTVGEFRYDSYRDCLVSGSLSGMKKINAHGQVYLMNALQVGQPAPNGEGLIYFNYSGRMYVLDRLDQLVPLLDIATGLQVNINPHSDEELVYDEVSNSLFRLTHDGPECAPSVTTASLYRYSLDATGMYLVSASAPVILGCPSTSMSLDIGPSGTVLTHTHNPGGSGPRYRSYLVDVHSMVPMLYATWTGDLRNFREGAYSPYLGSAVVASEDLVGGGGYYRDSIWSFAQGTTNSGAELYVDNPGNSCVFCCSRKMEVVKY